VGVLSCFVDQSVNDVNARIIAEERGLKVTEVKTAKGRDLSSGVCIKASVGDESFSVRGTLFYVGDAVEARVIQINEFLVELAPQGDLLVVRNQDRPGVIGSVGTLLGEKGINVNSLHVAHNKETGVALALWSIDNEIDEGTLAEVRKLPLIGSASLVRLD
jgi:D-3-phosphoglycerate dehydrogenase